MLIHMIWAETPSEETRMMEAFDNTYVKRFPEKFAGRLDDYDEMVSTGKLKAFRVSVIDIPSRLYEGNAS